MISQISFLFSLQPRGVGLEAPGTVWVTGVKVGQGDV